MSLSEQLNEVKQQSAAKIPADTKANMGNELKKLIESGLAEKAPKVGDTLTEFTLPSASGKSVSLSRLLEKGPAVITFYRGGWCPYCNLELRAYQNILGDINALGATLVAISPELPDNSLSTTQKNELEFEVLSDVNSDYGKSINVIFPVSDGLRAIMDGFGMDLQKYNGKDQFFLPLPATFVVDTDRTVAYAFTNADYSTRAEPSEVLDALKKLQK